MFAETALDNAASMRLLTQDRLLRHRASGDSTPPDRVHASMRVPAPALKRSRQFSLLNGVVANRLPQNAMAE